MRPLLRCCPVSAVACALLLAAGTATAAPEMRTAVAMDGDGGLVQVFDAGGGGPLLQPYGSGFSGGVRVAVGDLDGDGVGEIITGNGPGTVALVRVFDGLSLRPLAEILPFGPNFLGGVQVAAGDVDGDGRADIIVGSGAGGGGVVRIFDGPTRAPRRSFVAFDTADGGVNVAAGDLTGDGRDDIVVGAGAGGGPQVKVFDGRDGRLERALAPFANGFGGGITVAAGDIDGDGRADLVAGTDADPSAGSHGGPQVKVFSGADHTLLAELRPYGTDFQGGVRVATSDLDGDGRADLLTVPGNQGASRVSRWLAPELVPLGELPVLTPSHRGGLFVAASVVPRTILRSSFERTAGGDAPLR